MFDSASDILEFPQVLELIAACATSEPGAERVKKLHPLTDIELANLELGRVAEMVSVMEEGAPIPLKSIYELTQPLQTASVSGAMLNADILLKFSATLGCARLVKNFFLDRGGIVSRLAHLANGMSVFQEFESAVHRAIDETGEVRDSASLELRQIRSSIAAEKQRARSALARLMKQWKIAGYLREEIIASRHGRLTLPVKNSAKHSVKGVLVDESATGATVFIEPLETVEINNNIRRLELEEQREVERILRGITAIIYKHRFEIEETYDILLQFDSIFARAEYAQKYDCSQPTLSPEDRLKIVKGRHPLLLIKEAEVIPLDLEFEDGIYTLVISGPNAGGKTVALKTIGVLTMMAAAGCFVPAGLGTILLLPQEIHAVIGDDQSIAADLSSFSAHLSKLAHIAQTGALCRLILIDEIMSGTDPAEGTALAIALLEKLTAEHAITIVTTHKGDLKAYAHRAEGVMNGSLEFDPETLSPTYSFLYGIPGSSYAFALAQKVGLPGSIIEYAENLRGEDRGAMESLIIELQEKLTTLERDKAAVNSERLRAESLAGQLEDKLKHAKSIGVKMRERAESEADKILADANRAVESAIQQIREGSASKDAIRSAYNMIDSAKQSFRQKLRKKPVIPQKARTPIAVGDRVRLEDSDVQGTVIGSKDKKGRFLVETGGVKVWLRESILFKLPSSDDKDKGGKVRVKYDFASVNISPELDLRGLDGQQAAALLEEYLNHAVNTNLQRLDIIHGKGRGVLRKVVGDLLAKSPAVKSYRLGELGEGDTGVTIVELEV
ncbi:MAG: endonuclease MutS2 [candidate division Zixibacteria bacterium]|nr:endonuclease MutS2 [Candidatus Tariuqbacter arcticus]